MQLSLDERIHHATTMRRLFDKTALMLETKAGLNISGDKKKTKEKTPPAVFMVQIEGGYIDLKEAVFAAMDSILDAPMSYEFTSLDLFGHQYLMDLMLNTMRDNGVEPDGNYFVISRSLYRLAEMQEEIESQKDDEELEF